MVLDDAVHVEVGPGGQGKKETKLEQILLNGASVAMLVPGGAP